MEYPATTEFERGDAEFQVNGLSVFELNAVLVRNHSIRLGESWSMISANVDPLSDDIIELMAPLVEADNLILLKTARVDSTRRRLITTTSRVGRAVRAIN